MKAHKSILISLAIHLAIFGVSFTIFVGQKQKSKTPISYNIQIHVARTTHLRDNLHMTPTVFEPKINDPRSSHVDITQQKDDFAQPIVEREQRPVKNYERFGTLRLTPKKPKTKPQKNIAKSTVKPPKQKTATNNKKSSAVVTSKNSGGKSQSAGGQPTAGGSRSHNPHGDNTAGKRAGARGGSAAGGGSTAGVPAKIERPKLRKKYKIDYPQAAKRLRLSGSLMLKIKILKDGRVDQVEIVKGSGMRMLDKAAMKSVKTWLFYPATKNGNPVNSWIKVPITFRL
ncbi:energy transducer TonB [Candidatus Uabimicrobium amorphum]|uniref:Cell envelope biogenesis protein TonB n=1 Tax=Uabimicrobium amorphum TaxID=2596890 RepID=A0A5S9F6K0_UABAM|nr:energy transducer TonB [Candidatus Uabimicrobium amorphum]BBM87967.1 cell envelope biogenesis protein TonB [Candidatus Uabimicrobium amorphum]